MNSVLQILIHNKLLQDHFITHEFKDALVNYTKEQLKNKNSIITTETVNQGMTTTLTYQFYQLVASMRTEKIIAPKTFKMILGSKNEMFNGYAQNDAHELLNFILDTIHEETKYSVEPCMQSLPKAYHTIERVKKEFNERINKTVDFDIRRDIIYSYNTFEASFPQEVSIHNGMAYWAKYIKNNFSIVSYHFMGVYQSTIECSQCKHNSQSFEPFTTVSLEIPIQEKINVYDCLNNFTTCETLTDKYDCSVCNLKTIGKKSISFWNTPDVLFIHFKRFKLNEQPTPNRKIVGYSKINNHIDYPKVLDLCQYVSKYNKKTAVYNLTSVIHHYGNHGSGHYLCYNKIGDVWCEFNDGNITAITNFEKQIMTSASYILVYSKLSDN